MSVGFYCYPLKWNVPVHLDRRLRDCVESHALKLEGAYAGVGRIESASRKVDKAKEKLSVRPILIVKVEFYALIPLIVSLVLSDLVCLEIEQCETLCD